MKKTIYLLVLIIPIMSCASNIEQQANQQNANSSVQMSNGGAGDSSTQSAPTGSLSDFSDVIGKDWKLVAVYISGRDINFKRSSLPEPLSGAYSLKFDERIASGMAAPNRYTAPYTLGVNHSISIGLMATTMMASFVEPENLKEYEFTIYMQNSYAWTDENGQFVLLSKTADNRDVRLNFSL